MEATSSILEHTLQNPTPRYTGSAIAFIDDKKQVLDRYESALRRAGFCHVYCIEPQQDAADHMNRERPDLIYIEAVLDSPTDRGFELLWALRRRGFRGSIAMIAAKATPDLCYRAVKLGADDFLIRTPGLDIAKETARLLARHRRITGASWRPEAALATGLFSSLNLTVGELRALALFADGFPRQQEIAARLGGSEQYVRKVFSRIYKKLGRYLSVDNQAKLAHFLTICSLFN